MPYLMTAKRDISMPSEANLSVHVEEALAAARTSITKFTTRVNIEASKPSVWSTEQVADLREIADAIGHLQDALGEMAARARAS